ncbi:MAG: VanW family protein, partial [Patescibacteria group bacterium]
FFFFEARYYQRFFPGSLLGNINLEGLTFDEAYSLVEKSANDLEDQGIKIQKNNASLLVKSVSDSSSPDVAQTIFSLDSHTALTKAFTFGRDKSWWENLLIQVRMFFQTKRFEMDYDMNREVLTQMIKVQFSSSEKNELAARPEISLVNGSWQVEILPEETGMILDMEKALNDFENNLKNLDNADIILASKIELPGVKKSEVTPENISLIREIMGREPLKLSFEGNIWTLKKEDLTLMLGFQKKETVVVSVNPDKFKAWLETSVGEIINTPAQNARIEMENGKVTAFAAHQEGREIDWEKTLETVNLALNTNEPKVEILVRTSLPEILTESINDLGIKEIIGTGKSSFAGSPTNRRHNIKNGASKLQGMIIKPGEQFSLITALGPVDGTTGYRTELVIKGNKTTPEYGGGLCQIGTTVFRAAMASGLPILERQNHSYSVSYYLEDGLPGTDATIYIPKPDVRFLNDTGKHILIQSRIIGDTLYFDFWGAKDGRITERTKPKTWGWTSPLPTKYVETTDLPVGQKKCTESSHQGVSASFDYTVTYPDQEVKKTTFTSYYKPWQAVCLIGVEKLTETASSTPSIVDP